MVLVYDRIASNKRKSFLLILSFLALIVFLGYVLGEMTGFGYFGLLFAAALAGTMIIGDYYYGDKIVLSMSGAKPVEKKDNPYLYNTVEGLSIAAGIPMPKIYYIEDTAPNAFATGRNPQTASIAVTTGLVQKMNRLELEGVVAHEMSHVKNYDTRLMILAAVMVGIVVLLSDWILRATLFAPRSRGSDRKGGAGIMILVGIALAILAPLIAQIIRLAISRKREYLADADAALLTRYPSGLASALEKIAGDKEPLEVANKATAHLYISNPLKNSTGWFDSLFSTHPPIEERIRILKQM